MVGIHRVAAFFFALSASALALKVSNASTAAVTLADVKAEQLKLGKIAKNLDAMLTNGPMKSSKVLPAMKLFVGKLHAALEEVNGVTDARVAMDKLKAVKEGVAGLVGELTSRQETLMKDDGAQRQSLLLGVLMTRQAEPMTEQLKILQDSDFVTLAVSQALLKNHSDAVPLYVQVGAYLDEHHTSGTVSGVSRVQAVVASLQQRVDALKRELDVRAEHQQKLRVKLNELAANSSKRDKRVIQMRLKRSDHSFKKWSAVRRRDIANMEAAVEAVKKGDMKALERAREALMQSLKNMQSQNGGFIVFIQEANVLLQKDCPYCAAQCVDKCHSGGKSYAQCLGVCADAGKGK